MGLDCENDAEWSPVLYLYPPKSYGTKAQPVQAHLTLPTCGSCKVNTKLEDFVSDESWAKLVKAIIEKGKVAPVRERTVLGWRRYE